MIYKCFPQLWLRCRTLHPTLLWKNLFTTKFRGREMRNMNNPRQERHRRPLFLPEAPQLCMNKHFSMCCLPLVQFQSSEIIWTISPRFPVVLKRGFPCVVTPPCQKLLGIICYVYDSRSERSFSTAQQVPRLHFIVLGWDRVMRLSGTTDRGQGNAMLWLAKPECHAAPAQSARRMDSYRT